MCCDEAMLQSSLRHYINFLSIMKAIIFDLDGTLADLQAIEDITVAAAAKLVCVGAQIEPVPYPLLGRPEARSLYQAFLARIPSFCRASISEQDFVRAYDAAQVDLIRTRRYKPPELYVSIETLQGLIQEYDLYVVTGSRALELDYILLVSDFGKFFRRERRMPSDIAKEPKQTGRTYARIARRYGQGDVFVIGDGDADRAGAARAQLSFIEVNNNCLRTSSETALRQLLK